MLTSPADVYHIIWREVLLSTPTTTTDDGRDDDAMKRRRKAEAEEKVHAPPTPTSIRPLPFTLYSIWRIGAASKGRGE